MYNIKQLSFIAAAALISSSLMAREVQEEQNSEDRIDESERVSVTWVSPKDFTDMRPGMETRKRFRNNTMERLYEYIEKLANELPEGHKLKLNVTDVDLAGQVWPGGFVGFNNPNDVRIIRQVDVPRIDFSFELLDQSGKVLKSGEKELKDLAFQERIAGFRRNDSLLYEKNMMKRWFKKEFREELAAN